MYLFVYEGISKPLNYTCLTFFLLLIESFQKVIFIIIIISSSSITKYKYTKSVIYS